MKRFIVLLLTASMLLGLSSGAVHALQAEDAASAITETAEEILLPAEGSAELTAELTDGCQILQYVDAEQFRKSGHTQRLTDLEQLDTYVFRNQDGTRSVYYMQENVKYVDKEGNIREKNNTLVRETGGFRITENEFDLHIPHTLSDGVELSYAAYNVTLTPQGGNSGISGVQNGNAVVYSGYFGEGTALQYTPILSGVKEDIVLERCVLGTYEFLLETDGLYLCFADGAYYLAQEKGSDEPVLYLGEILVYDAVGKPSMGNMTVTAVEEGASYLLSVSADESFLNDPTTVYPVTIDPTIEVSDSATTGSIEDAPIFSGVPNANCGSYVYLSVGYVDETYKIGSALVRLPGLYNSAEFTGMNADQIVSATFNVNRSSKRETTLVIYPCTAEWSESTVTCNSFGGNTTTLGCWRETVTSEDPTSIDITTLVKYWLNGTYAAEHGFLITNLYASDSSYKFAPFSSEYSVSDLRPYVVLTYNATIELNYSSVAITKGFTRTLTATTNPENSTVTWTSGNTSVATVSSSGVITAVQVGQTTITAEMVDSAGTSHTASCTVYVKIADGVYKLQNINSLKYLYAEGMNITPGTKVIQTASLAIPTEETDSRLGLAQLWRIYYIANGYYSIRPLHKMDMGLYRSGNNVVIQSIGTSNTTDGVPSLAKWKIGYGTYGYVIRNQGTSAYTLQTSLDTTSDSAALVALGTSTKACQWTLSKVTPVPYGVLVYDKITGEPLTNPTKVVATGETRTIDDMDLLFVTYGATLTINAEIEFVQLNTGSVTLSSDGSVRGRAADTVSIGVKLKYGVTTALSASYTIQVWPFENGTYFMDNRQTDMYVDIKDQKMANGTVIHQWWFHAGATQKWIFTHVDGGYFTIRSAKSTTAYYLGVINDSTELDIDIVLRSGTITDGMLWKVVPMTGGSYKLVPKIGESYGYALVTTTSDSAYGAKLAQGMYVDNDSYRDEWFLYRFGERPYKMLALDEKSYNLDETWDNDYYFDGVGTMIKSVLYSEPMKYVYDDIPKFELQRLMSDSEIFIIQTHGQQDGIQINLGGVITMEDIEDLVLNEMKFALLLACSTAANFDESNITNGTPNNFVEQMVCNGAETVIGFEGPTYSKDNNSFAEQLFESMLIDGMTVEKAVEDVETDNFQYPNMNDLAFCRIGGNRDLVLQP